MYELRLDADGIYLVYLNGHQVIKLEAGFAEVIVMTFENLKQFEHRADDYMAGVCAGIMHCHLLRPDCFSNLPEVPPLHGG